MIRTTRSAKAEMASMSVTAAENFYTLLMVPAELLTISGNAELVKPATKD